MINKNNLWFITLSSIILVLGIYYLGMPTSDLNPIDEEVKETESVMNSSTALVALRVESDEETFAKMTELQGILLNEGATAEEKNIAYEELLTLNSNKGLEEELQKKIKEELSLDSFIKINSNQINVVIAKSENDPVLANTIIRLIQEKFDNQKYITVKFS